MRKLILGSLAVAAAVSAIGLYFMRHRVRSALSVGGSIHVASGLTSEVYASAPLLANPVSFAIDERGRFLVAETYRLNAGATDIRQHMSWLDDDLASSSVEDRIAILKRRDAKNIARYEQQADRVRLVWDQDGDGKADHSSVFADGFNGIADGLGSGLLARRGNVYYANVPNLWVLTGENDSGAAESRKPILHGFGVRIGFTGHDLHGLRIGPDGKLYFSMGDRGAHITITENGTERVISNPDDGAVFRCNLDGSGLELIARGLRNPQELAFDAYGNLWTGDNNGDGGDPSRWVYVVDGGDSGWRVGYQFLTPENSTNARGIWLAERMCYPHWPGQPAFIVPPVANLSNGPAGLAYYPGTGFSDRFNNHFFLCDFRGSGDSRVIAFNVKPKGAGFELGTQHDVLWGILVTDGDFGYDGNYYVSDWIKGWSPTGKGRIFRISDPQHAKDDVVREVKELFAGGFSKLSESRLTSLLEHRDMRVRQEAQFTLAEKAPEAAAAIFGNVIRTSKNQFARLHAIWGLGQIAAQSSSISRELERLLSDPDAEVRTQAAKVLGDIGKSPAKIFEPLLGDENGRVQFAATMAMRKSVTHENLPAILSLLRSNADQDPYLRHAGVMVIFALLEQINPKPGISILADAPLDQGSASKRTPGIAELRAALRAAMDDHSESVRMAILLALRRRESPEIVHFLGDPNSHLVAEAARAIHDLPIQSALPQLADLLGQHGKVSSFPAGSPEKPGPRDWLLRRSINANYRLGEARHAHSLVAFAMASTIPESLRVEALSTLASWTSPSGRDRITGLWRPVAPRNPRVAIDALEPRLAELQTSASIPVRIAAMKVAGQLKIRGAGIDLKAMVADASTSAEARVEALRSMARDHEPQLAEILRTTIADRDESLRKEAVQILARIKPLDALPYLRNALNRGSVGEMQNALLALGSLDDKLADTILAEWLDRLLAKNVDPRLTVDLLEAAAMRKSTTVQERLHKYERSRPAADDIEFYADALEGGDATEGWSVLFSKMEVSCIRCHKFNGEGGEVGPELAGIGAQRDRRYILESIVFPNRHFAPGFEIISVTLKDGSIHAGTLTHETDEFLEINSQGHGKTRIRKKDLQSRERGLSAMPEGLRDSLTKRELRNLVEFLAQSKPEHTQTYKN